MDNTLSSAEVAEVFGVTTMSVNRWVDAGLITPVGEDNPNPYLIRRPKLRFTAAEVERCKEARLAMAQGDGDRRRRAVATA
jgi:predicted site-specific integrase-resolvase